MTNPLYHDPKMSFRIPPAPVLPLLQPFTFNCIQSWGGYFHPHKAHLLVDPSLTFFSKIYMFNVSHHAFRHNNHVIHELSFIIEYHVISCFPYTSCCHPKIIDHCHLSLVVSLLNKLLMSQRVSVGLKNSCLLWCWTNYLKMFVAARKSKRVCMRSSTRDGQRWQWWLPVQCLDALRSFVNRPSCVSSHKKNFLFFQDRAISKLNSKFDPWTLVAWHWTLVPYKLI